MFSMVKMLTGGNFRTDAVACVVSTLLKWPMLQSISEEHQIWQQFGGEQWQAVWIIFVLETTAVLAWAHVPMSSGGDWIMLQNLLLCWDCLPCYTIQLHQKYGNQWR